MRCAGLLVCAVALWTTGLPPSAPPQRWAAGAPQPPSAADLPPAYRGGPVEQALAARDWPRAERLLVAAIEDAPPNPALLEILGSVFLIERKPLNAAIAFKKADAIQPLDNRWRFALVLAYISLTHGDWARPELERLTAADPANTAYEYWLGRLDYDAGHYRAAIAHYEQVLRRDPAFVRAHDNMGLAYEALNEPDRALLHYRKAVDLNRQAAMKSPWPATNLGILLRNQGQAAEAEALFREAVGYDPAFPQGRYQLAVLLEQQGREGDAIAELTRAAELDPAYAEPRYALARLYRRAGRLDEAAAALEAFQRLQDAKAPESRR